jgi:uncharacterized protein (TIGR02453 family)
MQISKSNLDFLRNLKKNNNREWFNQNKDWYLREYQNMIDFTDVLIDEMNKIDQIETPSGKRSLFRIYRDVRFGKDKSPYKSSWSGRLKRATPFRRGGYYFSITPGNSYAAGGFWGPNSSDLALIRGHIAQDDSGLRETITDKSFKKIFGQLVGAKVKTAPKGYSIDDPAIDLLRHKQFLVSHKFSDEEVLSPDFVDKVAKVFLNMHPFFDYMSEILTADLNGISLVD